jgi:hypothetical protein
LLNRFFFRVGVIFLKCIIDNGEISNVYIFSVENDRLSLNPKYGSISSSVEFLNHALKELHFCQLKLPHLYPHPRNLLPRFSSTLAASFLPDAFFRLALVAGTSSERPNRSRISLSEP